MVEIIGKYLVTQPGYLILFQKFSKQGFDQLSIQRIALVDFAGKPQIDFYLITRVQC